MSCFLVFIIQNSTIFTEDKDIKMKKKLYGDLKSYIPVLIITEYAFDNVLNQIMSKYHRKKKINTNEEKYYKESLRFNK